MMDLGRKPFHFDLSEVEKLGMLGATREEMASWFGCAVRTVDRRMAKADGDFRLAYDKGFGRLKISLRRQQIEAAKGGNITMLIWLGKQMLGQADRQEVKSEAHVVSRATVTALSPEDEEFLAKKARILAEMK
jgi:hypothetical protein